LQLNLFMKNMNVFATREVGSVELSGVIGQDTT